MVLPRSKLESNLLKPTTDLQETRERGGHTKVSHRDAASKVPNVGDSVGLMTLRQRIAGKDGETCTLRQKTPTTVVSRPYLDPSFHKNGRNYNISAKM